MLILYDPRCADYSAASHPERPARVLETAACLRRDHPEWKWREPPPTVAEATLLLAHTPEHLRRLSEPHDFDPDTPYFPGIGDHARRAVASAIAAARYALDGPKTHPVFSLMRPPGHHATAGRAMGFCYLNQVAVAALAAQQDLGAERVAIWDFDAHHGNGTEEILLGKKNCLYASAHQFPAYPGTGEREIGNCLNWPVPPRTPRLQHMAALRASWDAVLGFQPDLVLVSAGFDAYAGDPITEMTLERDDFATLGRWLGEAGPPAAALLEGGYSPELPQLIEAFLKGWSPE